MASDHQKALFHRMHHPDFYPHPTATVINRETHISQVFLTGTYAYKIKKPLDLGFLDFTTLDKRRHYCRQEVVLNRRLAPKVYLEVVPITHDGGNYHLAGAGPAVEYAVKMRQLPDSQSLAHLLTRRAIDHQAIQRLARHLARFYSQARCDADTRAVGARQTVRVNWEENFSQTAAEAGDGPDSPIERHRFLSIRAAVRSFLRRKASLFDRRLQQGKIRDCHGDLRAEHVYFSNGIQIIDCIEFNERFRYADVAADLAFLAMDLDFQGHGDVARQLMAAYVDHSRDEDMFALLDFYKCYRAYVRGKIGSFQLRQADPAGRRYAGLRRDTQRYFQLAFDYARAFTRPVLWIFCGLPASGKSTLAQNLAAALAVRHLKSDAVRKTWARPQGESAFEQGLYTKGMTALTYGRLLLAAQDELENGTSMILDATFSRRHQRREARRLARDMDAQVIFVHCRCSDASLKKRLRARQGRALLSDARLPLLNDFKANFEPPTEIPADMLITVDTDQPQAKSMARILTHDVDPQDRIQRN